MRMSPGVEWLFPFDLPNINEVVYSEPMEPLLDKYGNGVIIRIRFGQDV